MKEEQIGSVLKHFPGYGNNVDTHKKIARDKRTEAEFQQNDWRPFRAGVEAGADAVLVSHIIVEAFDASAPASLSLPVHQKLRQEINFKGVVITDDLKMWGLKNFFDGKIAETELIEKALQAGNDMLIYGPVKEDLINNLVISYKENRLNETELNQAVERILHWKYDLFASEASSH